MYLLQSYHDHNLAPNFTNILVRIINPIVYLSFVFPLTYISDPPPPTPYPQSELNCVCLQANINSICCESITTGKTAETAANPSCPQNSLT